MSKSNVVGGAVAAIAPTMLSVWADYAGGGYLFSTSEQCERGKQYGAAVAVVASIAAAYWASRQKSREAYLGAGLGVFMAVASVAARHKCSP